MKQIDRSLHQLVQKGDSPSVHYLLFNQEEILHRYQEGLADVAGQVPTDENTVYNAFSCTKTFTALAVLQLAEKDKLDLDQPAAGYMNDFPYPGDITVRQLLNHTAGLPNPNPLGWIHLASEHRTFDRDLFFRNVFAKHSRIKSGPNQKFAYSNLGYVLLGQLIEQVSGMKYEDYITQYVLQPLQLGPAELGFELPESVPVAKGYHKHPSLMNWIIGIFINKKEFRGKAEGRWQPFLPYHLNAASYGGLMGTPQAFMTYIQELLKEDSSLISPDYKKELFTENRTLDKKPTGMCLSWFKGELNGKNYFAHTGGGGGYYCEIRIYPEAGIGSVIMLNRSGMTDKRVLNQLDKFYLSPS